MRYRMSVGVGLAWLACGAVAVYGQGFPFMSRYDHAPEDRVELEAVTGNVTPCANGTAGPYACSNADLLAFLPVSAIGGGGSLNDVWGWKQGFTGWEYALVGRTDGTAFVNTTDPTNPVYLGKLPTHTGTSSWRDIKVYRDHAFIVSDNNGNHGMQVFDLVQLLFVNNPPVNFTETAHYGNFASAHNIAINEETGFAYVVGANGGGTTCGGGLHMVNIQTPTAPTFAGCFSADGYTHDVQCVVYRGPDGQHEGKEICVASNEDTITIVDVSDKANPVQLGRIGYPTSGYIHQGWLDQEHRYFYQNDELDGGPTRTLIWDLADLDNPLLANEYLGPTTSKDHNLYIVGDLMYEANYTTGLRVLDISDRLNPVERAYFDTYTPNDGSGFSGAWSNYPFFPSQYVLVSSIGEGLFIVRPAEFLPPAEVRFGAVKGGGFVELTWKSTATANQTGYEVQRREGGAAAWEVLTFIEGDAPGDYHYRVEGLLPGRYVFRLRQLRENGSYAYSPEVEVFVELPDAGMQADVYPNPFRDRSTLRLVLAEEEHVRVSVVDVLGRRVALLYDGLMPAGEARRFTLDGAALPSGTYLWHVEGARFSRAGTVTLVK